MMVKKTAGILIALGMAGHISAQGADFLARFNGGIGVIPVSNGAGPVNPDGTFPNVKLNIVRGVNPGAGPWTIADLRADVQTDGRIDVKGRGLLLASSNSIGQNANQSVFATLICEAAAPFVEHSTGKVPLDRRDCGGIVLHKQSRGRAAAERFDAQGTRPREEIENTRAKNFLTQAGEDCGLHAVHRRAHLGFGNIQPNSAGPTCDYSHGDAVG